MQGLPFFSFSSQGAGPLTDGQPSPSPLSGPENIGHTPQSLAKQESSDLPEFMQRLLQAMTQETPAVVERQGQKLAAEEVTDPLLELQEGESTTQPIDALPLLQPSKMDMDSIQTQRNFAPSVNPLPQTQSQAMPSLMARAQLNQKTSASEQSMTPLMETGKAEQPQPLMATQPQSSTPLIQPMQTQTQASVDVMQSTVEVQSKLAPQGSSTLGNPLKNMGLDEKANLDSSMSSNGNGNGSANDTGKLAALMTPMSEPKPVADKIFTTEQLASMSAGGINEMASEVGDTIDEMWQQSQAPARQAAAKPAAGNVPSFFEQIQAKLDLPPTDVRFGEQVSKRIGMMVTEQMQSARIQLDPPELGSLEIKVRVQQDQVNVSFASNNQAVRDALEAQAPRLREMLNQQGVDLGNLDVSSQGQQNQGGDGRSQGDGEHLLDDDGLAASDALETLEQQIKTIENDGSVDYFA